MNFKNLLAALVAALSLNSLAAAGDFNITGGSAAHIDAEYTGSVEPGDVEKWLELARVANGRVIHLTINSGGGYAWVGAELYWLMDAYPSLITEAGDYGAWSAAGLMWLAGDYRYIGEDGKLGFHRAFCRWDAGPFPNIGCDVTEFDIECVEIFEHAGYNGLVFMNWLYAIQTELGTDGWIYRDLDGWWIIETSGPTIIPFDEEKIL